MSFYKAATYIRNNTIGDRTLNIRFLVEKTSLYTNKCLTESKLNFFFSSVKFPFNFRIKFKMFYKKCVREIQRLMFLLPLL